MTSGLRWAELGVAIIMVIGIILMACETCNETFGSYIPEEVYQKDFTLFVIVKVTGLVLFFLGVFILRRIDPDNWVNPWERRKAN